jgi:hypothetical protein
MTSVLPDGMTAIDREDPSVCVPSTRWFTPVGAGTDLSHASILFVNEHERSASAGTTAQGPW